ncbi:hypothetical protein [Streptomyces capitiformicae]|uniref:Uncharacterized protein n=1 Tax=Streptomyces capitiformicae TaxID=2014920 RepID=A0A918ZCP5_9ACTN|nr:hypothetical protein [Streptomyces capitiformicae]GHE44590.1 hypothetical protein GCM10017771_64770 [Streptomyces capitiformicae]
MTAMVIGPLVSTAVTTAVVLVRVGPRMSSLAQWLNHELSPLTWGSGKCAAWYRA